MRERHSDLTAEQVRKILAYDLETGVFRWRQRICQKGKAGSIAGTVGTQGYWVIGINYKVYRAGRLAWLYVTGEWPQGDVDHIDTDKTNNCWLNLRDISHSANGENQRKAQSNNKIGLLGVSLRKKSGPKKWLATISVKGKRIHLGSFETPEEAHQAYINGKRVLHEGCTL